jgi:hypothetical protein
MAAGPAKSAAAGALLLFLLPLPAQAQVAPPRGASEQFGEQLAGTQEYLERRWLVLILRDMVSKNTSGNSYTTLQADARRLGTRGPSAQDWTTLDADLARAIDAYLDDMEAQVRGGKAKWPQDRPRTGYDNSALIMIESIRVHAKDAVAKRADPMPVLMRANKLNNWLQGNQQFYNYFFGRDEAVEGALRSVTMASPKPAAR